MFTLVCNRINLNEIIFQTAQIFNLKHCDLFVTVDPNVGETTQVIVDVGSETARVMAEVEGPGGAPVNASVNNNNNGSFTVEYTPNQVGLHKIFLNINNQDMPGAIETHVTDPNLVSVTSTQYQAGKLLENPNIFIFIFSF